jgi:hypothetical protein
MKYRFRVGRIAGCGNCRCALCGEQRVALADGGSELYRSVKHRAAVGRLTNSRLCSSDKASARSTVYTIGVRTSHPVYCTLLVEYATDAGNIQACRVCQINDQHKRCKGKPNHQVQVVGSSVVRYVLLPWNGVRTVWVKTDYSLMLE